jgi:hypothetical protein
VEPKYFDDERGKKRQRREKKEETKRKSNRKRKAGQELDLPQAKRQARGVSDKENTAPGLELRAPMGSEFVWHNQVPHSRDQSPDESDESGEDANEEDMHVERRVVYETSVAITKRRMGPKVKNDDELEPAMDDFINAGTRGFKCSRVPVRIYFGNDKTGMWFSPLICECKLTFILFSIHVTFPQNRTICCATLISLLAARGVTL